jgi:hypothetical protein
VPHNTAVPLEIRAGLGPRKSAEEQHDYQKAVEELAEEGIRIYAINTGDPAGREKASKLGDRTAIVGMRFDRASRPWITYLRSGQWGAQQQKEEAYAAQLYNGASRFLWEIIHDSGVEKAWSDFFAEKTREAGHPVSLPMEWVTPKRIITKQQRIEELEPYFRRGVFILYSAGPQEEIELFISQFCEYLISDHDDYPDAAANAIEYIKALPAPKAAAPATEEPIVTVSESGVPMVAIGALLQKMREPKGTSWGAGGRG